MPAQPPAGDGPNDYIILLFEQPEGWTIPMNYSNVNPPSGAEDVVGFDVADFVAARRLRAPGESNYFRVENRTVTDAGVNATATSNAATAKTTYAGGSASASPRPRVHRYSRIWEPPLWSMLEFGRYKVLCSSLCCCGIGRTCRQT